MFIIILLTLNVYTGKYVCINCMYSILSVLTVYGISHSSNLEFKRTFFFNLGRKYLKIYMLVRYVQEVREFFTFFSFLLYTCGEEFPTVWDH
jgi:hypothetical protein